MSIARSLRSAASFMPKRDKMTDAMSKPRRKSSRVDALRLADSGGKEKYMRHELRGAVFGGK